MDARSTTGDTPPGRSIWGQWRAGWAWIGDFTRGLRAMVARLHLTERVAPGISSVGVQATMGLVRTRGDVLHVSLRRRVSSTRMSLAVAMSVVSVGASVPLGGLMFAPVQRTEGGWTHSLFETDVLGEGGT